MIARKPIFFNRAPVTGQGMPISEREGNKRDSKKYEEILNIFNSGN